MATVVDVRTVTRTGKAISMRPFTMRESIPEKIAKLQWLMTNSRNSQSKYETRNSH